MSKFGNFTIRNGRKVEEPVNKTAVNGPNEGDQKSLKEIKNGQQNSKNANPSGVAKKETSRAPLVCCTARNWYRGARKTAVKSDESQVYGFGINIY